MGARGPEGLGGRHALVTGGGSGIGAAVALALADAGAHVTITGRRIDALQAIAERHASIAPIAADVTDEAALAAAFAAAQAARGPLSIVVANAGAAETAPFAKTSRATFERMLAVNLTGTFLTLREGLRAMGGSDWGRLVAVASVAGLKGFPYASAYAAAKHGTIGLVRSLAGELAATGITANSVCPGFTESPLLDKAVATVVARTGRSDEEARAALAAGNPMKRFITPEEVAAAVLYLCGPHSGSINGQSLSVSGGRDMVTPQHVRWRIEGRVGIVALDRPERKNPLTFESYAELRDLFRALPAQDAVRAVVFASNGGNFSSGGDVHDIIGPLIGMDMAGLLAFTRLTGDLVKAMLHCGVPIVAAVDGICVGAGAIIAMASDIRFASPAAKTAFLFTRVGLSGADMGACAILPRIIGQGRAAELLYTGRSMSAEEGERWGFFNRIVAAEQLEAEAVAFARGLAEGPSAAHSLTKTQLVQEWAMGLDQAIEAEAQAQALAMQTRDFERAYRAFVAKAKPVFEGD